jgi:hypothetical protein
MHGADAAYGMCHVHGENNKNEVYTSGGVRITNGGEGYSMDEESIPETSFTDVCM